MTTPRTPEELDRLLRGTVAAKGRELVPDSAVPPPLDLTRATAGDPATVRGTTPRRPAWWLTTGLAAATVALLVVGTAALHAAQTGAERPAGPTPATTAPTVTVTTTTTPAPTRTPDRSANWTADPQPFTAPVRPTTAPAVAPPPATTAPATTAPATTPATTASAVGVGVYADCNQPPAGNPWVQRPTAISLACADAGEILEDITWTSWGPSGAVGRATVVLKTCTPDCATGGFTRSATTVTLSEVRPDASGRPTFTVVRLGPDPIPTHPPEHPGYYVLLTHP